MSNVIKVNFKNRRSNCPKSFYMRWVSAEYKRCPDPVAWTYHVAFRVYETDKNFAVQFMTGIGSKGQKSPHAYSRSKPVYKKDLDKLWYYIFDKLDFYRADVKAVESAIRKVAV